MKRLKKVLVMILCLLMIQIPSTAVSQPCSVQAAAVKSGLKYENGKYYYYQNGSKIKSKWKTVTTKDSKGKKVSYRYYFGKDGAAYAGKKRSGVTYCFTVKKIGTKSYGFDYKGRMLKGIYVSNQEKFYVFDSKTGVYNAAQSSKLNKAAVYNKSSETLRSLLKSRKPVKTESSSSCFFQGGKDIVITYDHYIINYSRNKAGTKEVFIAAYSR